MNLIVNVDKNWAIGNKNKLLVSIPADMKFFRETTTRDAHYQVKGAVVVHSLEELLEELKQYPDESIYVIGGESVYRMMLPYCTEAYVTKTDHAYDADTYFPNLDEEEDWILEGESDEQTYFDLEYIFTRYRKKNYKRLMPEKKLDNRYPHPV